MVQSFDKSFILFMVIIKVAPHVILPNQIKAEVVPNHTCEDMNLTSLSQNIF